MSALLGTSKDHISYSSHLHGDTNPLGLYSFTDTTTSSTLTSRPPKTSVSSKGPETEIGAGEAANNDYSAWLILYEHTKAVLELDRLPEFLSRVKGRIIYLSGNKRRDTDISLAKRLLFLILWSIGYISVSVISSLFIIFRAMFGFRVFNFNMASRLGIGPSSPKQQISLPREDASSASMLLDRLEVTNLAVKQLKSEGLALQKKLKTAGERNVKLEASQADYAALRALQEKYTRVCAEIARLVKENAELKDKGTGLTKDVEELRGFLSMKETVSGNDANRLSMFARLQNQTLDSCKSLKEDRDPNEENTEALNEDSEDSVIILMDPESSTNSSEKSSNAPSTRAATSSVFAGHLPLPMPLTIKPAPPALAPPPISSQPEALQMERGNPIPVYTTPRPSLPPKASKPRLKPLLLAEHFAVGGAPRRNGGKPKYGSTRRQYFHNTISMEGGKFGTAEDKGRQNGKTEPDSVINAKGRTASRVLNPCASVFTPRIAIGPTPGTDRPVTKSATIRKFNDAKPSQKHGMVALSPALSPYIFNSPSPNSPFFRPAPLRRQTGGSTTPSLTTTPPTPSAPIAQPLQPRTDDTSTSNATSGNDNNNAGTPRSRSTRASSVRLIRARAAQRNSQRVASGGAAVQEGSPAGLKTVVDHINGTKGAKKEGYFKNKLQGKAYLEGKGMPPRRVLGERTNTEPGMYEAAAADGRWTSA